LPQPALPRPISPAESVSSSGYGSENGGAISRRGFNRKGRSVVIEDIAELPEEEENDSARGSTGFVFSEDPPPPLPFVVEPPPELPRPRERAPSDGLLGDAGFGGMPDRRRRRRGSLR